MRVIEHDDIKVMKDEIIGLIKEGKVFIHPTDTIYGIGCDATSSSSVEKVREIKDRPERPFSVIAPSLEWIKENLEIDEDASGWLEKLPGPYTFILKLKNKRCIAEAINNGMDTLGVRIPDHWSSKLANELGLPIVTTSANIVGQDYMKDLESLDPTIKSKVHFILYEGEINGVPSKVVDLTKQEAITIRN
ncbi:threonylcarbamoyl-AMP synthase [Candidatus Woesearchaeota archaeon]|nr:threonylcarbamoyl-AMP synthase [Candidatus Woesearchaeota archaeon]